MQQALLDEGYHRGKVDGVIGLRTRAGIRAYQKAENLPLTGGLDKEKAVRLGVSPEVREQTSYEIEPDKPPAGTRLDQGFGTRPQGTPEASQEMDCSSRLTGDPENPKNEKAVVSSLLSIFAQTSSDPIC